MFHHSFTHQYILMKSLEYASHPVGSIPIMITTDNDSYTQTRDWAVSIKVVFVLMGRVTGCW